MLDSEKGRRGETDTFLNNIHDPQNNRPLPPFNKTFLVPCLTTQPGSHFNLALLVVIGPIASCVTLSWG